MDKITVKYGLLKKVVKNFEKINPTDDTEVSFEYLVGSCFPDIMENIKKEMRRQYTNGYAEGLKRESIEEDEEVE